MEVLDDFKQLFQNIGKPVQTKYLSNNEAMVLLHETMDQFVSDVKEAICEGKVPQKFK